MNSEIKIGLFQNFGMIMFISFKFYFRHFRDMLQVTTIGESIAKSWSFDNEKVV